MNYCYARVSTEEQKLDRQIAQFEVFKPYTLITDKESGKDFDRKNYQKMKKKLKKDDWLIVSSLDRFGRNYDLIKQEWQYLTNKGVKITVIDMPIIDTTKDDLTSKLISDIVIQLLSYVAQTEREMIHKRQAEGIAVAKSKGIKFGRPKINLPDNFNEIAKKYMFGEIDNIKACEMLGLTRPTFFRYLKESNYYEMYTKIPNKNGNDRRNIGNVYRQFMNKEIKSKQVSELLNDTLNNWYPRYKKWQRKELKK